MNAGVTNGASQVACLRLIVRRLRCPTLDIVQVAVTFETQLTNRVARQQFWICRTVRCVARGATLGLERSMFECERTLLVAVALDARGISTD